MSKIAGIVNNHIRFCDLLECNCRKIRLDEKDHETMSGNLDLMELSKSAKGSQTVYLQAKYKGLTLSVCEVLNLTLQNLSQIKDNGEKEIIKSYVNYFLMNRVFNALHDIMLAEERPLNLFQQLQLFCLKFICPS